MTSKIEGVLSESETELLGDLVRKAVDDMTDKLAERICLVFEDDKSEGAYLGSALPMAIAMLGHSQISHLARIVPDVDLDRLLGKAGDASLEALTRGLTAGAENGLKARSEEQCDCPSCVAFRETMH